MIVLSKLVLAGVYERVEKIIGRPFNRYDENTCDFVWDIENDLEGAVLIGAVKDALAKYRIEWLLICKPDLWGGQFRVGRICYAIGISTQERPGTQLGFYLRMADLGFDKEN